jgi:hypothetical protein
VIVLNSNCNTQNYPIVKTAQVAFEKGKETQNNADRYFQGIFHRPHLVGKGETYTGKTPAGVVQPAVIEADKNLESVSVDILVKFIIQKVREGLHEQFAQVKEAEKHANHSIEVNREYMEAYAKFTHYTEWSTTMLKCIQDAITERPLKIQCKN